MVRNDFSTTVHLTSCSRYEIHWNTIFYQNYQSMYGITNHQHIRRWSKKKKEQKNLSETFLINYISLIILEFHPLLKGKKKHVFLHLSSKISD